MKGEID